MQQYCSILTPRSKTKRPNHIDLTPKQARRLVLHSQGLLRKAQLGRGINAVAKTINQIHHVQIDTISVVERAHHHILRTRVPNYTPDMLHNLQSNRREVFEYWFHAAAYLPMDDYRYYLPIMKGYRETRVIDKKFRKLIMARIRGEGPLMSKDFEAPPGHKSGGWWDWKPAKRAMESLFFAGELMIRERKGFQKVYDLAENVLPDHVEQSLPTAQERGHYYVRRMLTALGIAKARDIGYARGAVRRLSNYQIAPGIDNSLQEMIESGEVTQVHYEGALYYCLTDVLAETPKRIGRRHVRFLSSFDNLVINRKRLLELFGFNYQLECYVPEAKRRYGYFALPILFGDELIGRMDCKAVRKEGRLKVNNIWLEPETSVDDELADALAGALRDYQLGLGCEQLELVKTQQKHLKVQLQSRL